MFYIRSGAFALPSEIEAKLQTKRNLPRREAMGKTARAQKNALPLQQREGIFDSND